MGKYFSLQDEIAVLKTNQAAAAAPLNLQANSVPTAPLAVTEVGFLH